VVAGNIVRIAGMGVAKKATRNLVVVRGTRVTLAVMTMTMRMKADAIFFAAHGSSRWVLRVVNTNH
jgi:hypothetical protein